MGLTFKPNIDDLRESPAELIVENILNDQNGSFFSVVEPNIKAHRKFILTDFEDAFNDSDIVVFLVAHNEFKKLKAFQNKIIIDFCGVLNN